LTSASSSIGYADDGFSITVAEPWVKQQVRIITQYLISFVNHQQGKVDQIIFVDLVAGSGFCSLGAKREIFPGAPLMALQQDLPISKFVFCENDPEKYKALKIRVSRYFKDKNVVMLESNWEELAARINLYVPPSQDNFKTAVFCLCNPFSFEVPFDLLDRLPEKDFNFLVPFTFPLNERINYKHYLQHQREKLKNYLGGYKDMGKLEKNLAGNTEFYKRLLKIYEKNMETKGMNSSFSTHKLDSGLMEMPTYTIGLFSKLTSSKLIHRDVIDSESKQTTLFK
jgi:three-Cys-motif partner protein